MFNDNLLIFVTEYFSVELSGPDVHGAIDRSHLPRHRQSLLPGRSVGQGSETLALTFKPRFQPALSHGCPGATGFEIIPSKSYSFRCPQRILITIIK